MPDMRQNQAQWRRTRRSSGKGASAYRTPSGRPKSRRTASRRPNSGRVSRRRTAVVAGRRSRRPLLFYGLVVSVFAQMAAAFAGSGDLVALFTLTGLLLSAVAIHAAG